MGRLSLHECHRPSRPGHSPRGHWQDQRRSCRKRPMPPTEPRRPAWLNWLILAAFLWSSWQLAGLWFERLHGS